jgi:hypothetical protein
LWFDKADGLVKSLESPLCVIPAQAGIWCFQLVIDSRLRGSDVVSNFLRIHQGWKAWADEMTFSGLRFGFIRAAR